MVEVREQVVAGEEEAGVIWEAGAIEDASGQVKNPGARSTRRSIPGCAEYRDPGLCYLTPSG